MLISGLALPQMNGIYPNISQEDKDAFPNMFIFYLFFSSHFTYDYSDFIVNV